MDFVVKKCLKCGAFVRVFTDCNCENCGIKCCGEEMTVLVPNTEDANAEKHIPTYEIVEDKIMVKVNHPMDEDHYIEWIAVVFDGKECITYLKPGMEPIAHCKYVKGSKIYAYCNKHNLWMKEVE